MLTVVRFLCMRCARDVEVLRCTRLGVVNVDRAAKRCGL